MKKIVITVCLVAVFFGWYGNSSAGCNNGMMLPKGARVSAVLDTQTLQSTVSITGVEVEKFEYYSHEKGAQPLKATTPGTYVIENVLEGRGFNFTFPHSECSNKPFALLTPTMMSEAKAAGLTPYFIGKGIGVDCSRQDGSCAFIVTGK